MFFNIIMYKKVVIGKGKEKKKVPETYVPKGLSKKDKEKQVKSIIEGKKRPKVDSFKSKRSSYVVKFEKKYGVPITNKKYIYTNIISKTGVDKILAKGKAAYFSSGSRPNQNMFSWSNARLASVIVGGPARRVDKAIWEKYKKV
jgi:hypothetical protein